MAIGMPSRTCGTNLESCECQVRIPSFFCTPPCTTKSPRFRETEWNQGVHTQQNFPSILNRLRCNGTSCYEGILPVGVTIPSLLMTWVAAKPDHPTALYPIADVSTAMQRFQIASDSGYA